MAHRIIVLATKLMEFCRGVQAADASRMRDRSSRAWEREGGRGQKKKRAEKSEEKERREKRIAKRKKQRKRAQKKKRKRRKKATKRNKKKRREKTKGGVGKAKKEPGLAAKGER